MIIANQLLGFQEQWQRLLLIEEAGGQLLEAPITPASEGMRIHVTVADDRSGSLSLELRGGRNAGAGSYPRTFVMIGSANKPNSMPATPADHPMMCG